MRSMRMNPPRSRLSAYGSNTIGCAQLDRAHADVIELELLRGNVLQRVDVHLVFQRRHGGVDRLRPDLQQVRTALQHRPIVHPDDRRLELIGDGRRGVSGREHVAAADVDFVGKGQRDRLPGHGRIDDPGRPR